MCSSFMIPIETIDIGSFCVGVVFSFPFLFLAYMILKLSKSCFRDVRRRGKKHEMLVHDERARVNVWTNMTVAELAESAGRSVDDVFEIIIEAQLDGVYDTPESGFLL